jgi:hypothetical protein
VDKYYAEKYDVRQEREGVVVSNGYCDIVSIPFSILDEF